MGNRTILNELFLSGLSDLPSLQLPLFLFFLLIYLLTFIWNFLIISLIVTDSHLHVPMYFFLGNLAGLDLCYSSVTVPRMLFDLLTKTRKISVKACITQAFFFISFMGCKAFLLTVMSYDRYTAICHPLHYIQIMSWKVTLQAFSLTFCGSGIIGSFVCDLPQLFRISCSESYINILLTFFSVSLLGGGSLILTILSYVYIFRTVLKIQAQGNRSKVFSTCTSHLTVVLVFYGSVMFNYFWPNSSHYFSGDKVASVFYTTITPLLNPLIYSLRNQDFRTAFQGVLRKIFPLK